MFVSLKRILMTLYRIEENQQVIMADLQRLREQAARPIEEGAEHDGEPDKLIQEGIANIMAFQAGGKKGENE